MPRRRKNVSSDRFSYLRELVTEFQDTASSDAKEQVLANLANFAYDPENYCHIKALNIVDLFLDQLQAENENLIEFAIGGLCNLVLDKGFKRLICDRGGVEAVKTCLRYQREEIVLSAVTTLMYLVCPESRDDITCASVIDCMLRFEGSQNRRLANLASVFLQDYCTPSQIQNAKLLAAAHEGGSSAAT